MGLRAALACAVAALALALGGLRRARPTTAGRRAAAAR